MDALILTNVTSKKRKTHLKYVMLSSTMDLVPGNVTCHLTSPKKQVEI